MDYFLIIQIFTGFLFVFICYQYYVSIKRRIPRTAHEESTILERFRRRFQGGGGGSDTVDVRGGGDGGGRADSNNGVASGANVGTMSSLQTRIDLQSLQDQMKVMDPATAEARKTLVLKNLFRRTIQREEFLAISRDDVVEGENVATDTTNDATDFPDPGLVDEEMGVNVAMETKSSTSNSSLPPPSAPSIPIPNVTTTSTTTNENENDATASKITNHNEQYDGSNNNNQTTIPLGEVVRTFWDGRTQPEQPSSEKNDQTPPPHVQAQSHHISQTQKLHHAECSICLERFVPNDIISWAKDGGDATNNTDVNSRGQNGVQQACDHIFHEECLLAWLQYHDECPLCRRKVVHEDAEDRFAAWDGQ